MKFFIALIAIIGLTTAVLAANPNSNPNPEGGKPPGSGNGCTSDLVISSLLRIMLVDYYQLNT